MRDIYDITNDLFTVFEEMKMLFRHWTKEGPDAFMEGVAKLRKLESELEQVTGDELTAHKIIKGIYLSIFPQTLSSERMNVLKASHHIVQKNT